MMSKPARNPQGIRSQREVGRLLGISQAAVKKTEHKALIKLVTGLRMDPVMIKLASEITNY